MLPRVLKYSGANFWDLRKDDVVDFDEMRGAYLRATEDDLVTRLKQQADEWCFDEPVRIFLEAADEIERLRKQVRELQSEVQRLEKLANYG